MPPFIFKYVKTLFGFCPDRWPYLQASIMIYSLAVVSESNTDFSRVEVGLHDVSFRVLMFYAFCSKPSASFHSGTFFSPFLHSFVGKCI